MQVPKGNDARKKGWKDVVSIWYIPFNLVFKNLL